MAQNQADGTNRGGIRPSSPAYFFWMKFLEKQPELRNELQRRVMCGDGYIDWDFLPKLERIGRFSKAAQYRRALGCVRETIDACSSNLANLNSSYIVERIEYLKSLGDLTDQIVARRRSNIYNHDSLANRVVESFSAKKPIKSHKEIYEVWIEIRNAITLSTDVLTRELERRRPTSQAVQQAQRPVQEDSSCVIL